MQTVRALKPLPGRQEGSVYQLDENSARVHRDRGNVEFVDADEAPEVGGLFVRTETRLSGAAVTQVAAADYPPQPEPPANTGDEVVGEPVDSADGDQTPAEVVNTATGEKSTGVIPAEAKPGTAPAPTAPGTTDATPPATPAPGKGGSSPAPTSK